MRYAVIIGTAVITAVLIKLKRKYTAVILACFGLLMIAMGALYNIRLMDKVLPSVRPVNQSFYQPKYLESGEFPDSLLMQLFKGKRVYVRDDMYLIDDTVRENKVYLYAYYHARNMYWFLERAGAEYVKDAGMNDKQVMADLSEDAFVRLGYTNDMFRYCFMYNDIEDEPGNYFNYYWYFYEYLDAISAYVCEATDINGETVFTADELVVLWQPTEGSGGNKAVMADAQGKESDTAVDEGLKQEDEDIYIMTKAYYDTEVCADE